MTPARLKEIMRMAKKCLPDKLHDLYMEVYGADFAGKVDAARARASIREACAELLQKKGKVLPEYDPVAPLQEEEVKRVNCDPPSHPARRTMKRRHCSLEPL